MEKRFSAANLAEANRLADEWLAGQKGLKLISRTSFNDPTSFNQATAWTATIHYEEAKSN
jgi:hypothetical protein